MIYVFLTMLSLLAGQVIITYSYGHYNPFVVVVIVYGIGTVYAMGLVAFKQNMRRQVWEMRRVAKPLFFLLCVMSFNAFCYFASLYLIGISGISTLSNISTIAIIFGGIILYKEHLNLAKAAMIIVTVISAILFSFSKTVFDADKLGILLAVLAGLTWAQIHFMVKNISADMGGLPFAIIRTPFLFVFFAISALILSEVYPSEHSFEIAAVPWTDWVLFASSALFLTILTYTFMPLSMRYADLSTIAIINALRPMLAFFIGIYLFAESVDDFKMIAALMTIGSGFAYSFYIYYTRKKRSLI